MRKATAGSVVVPDLEITLMQTSLPSHISRRSESAEEEMLFPAKYTEGKSFFFSLTDGPFTNSIAARAPRYEPPMPITTRMSALF